MINLKLCMMVVLIELYLFISLSVTLIVLQGQSNLKQFYLKIFCSYPIEGNFVQLLITSNRP